MAQSLAVVKNGQANEGYSRSEEFSSGQLSDVYGTIFALKLKLEAVARELAHFCETREPLATVAGESPPEALVETAMSDRARRELVLPARLFADPAWDMLLELYRAELRQYRISISNLCAASNGPATTGLRWIATLESEGLVIRDADPLDRRRYYIRLTDAGSQAMTAYFSRSTLTSEVQRCAR